jgi:Na+/proline symporter
MNPVIRRRPMWAILFLAVVILVSTDALAYLDPGTGSILLQALAGGVAGVALLVKLYWKKLKKRFERGKHDG